MAQDNPALSPSDSLLVWYDAHARRLPWRARPGERPDPYRVWLSEVMLQQTTVATVRDYFLRFTELWPSVETLAAAELDDVLRAWAGLGYYARARNLHKCARILAEEHGGRFPETEAALRALPGVGRYTAAAIAAIAFGERSVVVDGNVERVMARLFRVETPLPAAKTILYDRAQDLTPAHRPGDYAQAVMDLGATVCTPRRPKCLLCPWEALCAGKDRAEDLPRKAAKKEKPTRHGLAYLLMRADGAVLLRRRPERGLLGGMIEVPGTTWTEDASAAETPPLEAALWRDVPGRVRHTFTHFHLEISVRAGKVDGRPDAPDDCLWCPLDAIGDQALPTVMRKVVAHGLKGLA